MQYDYADNGTRGEVLTQVRRVVVKIGTRLLMDVKGQGPAERIRQLMKVVGELRQSGLEVVVVTSGAIGAGMELLELRRRPKGMAALQALAAVGQCQLMTLYEEASSELGFHCGQLLLTAADLHDRSRHLRVAQCLNELLAREVLPVINENDSVCVDEIKVGDNDTLAALVAGMARADLTILLTTIDGMRERDETTGELGKRMSVVHELGSEIYNMAQGTDGNRFSVGGMVTKLRAAAMVTRSGEPLIIAEGFDFAILPRIMAAEDVGTIFLPSRHRRMHARQRFLAFFSEPQGELIVDEGAAKALISQGRSLLPGGIVGLRGVFKAGDTVSIVNLARQEIARGTVNFNHEDVSRICGAKSGDLARLLDRPVNSQVVVHRDAMVLL